MLITPSGRRAPLVRAASWLAALAGLVPGCAAAPPGTTALAGAAPLFPRAWVIREDADLAAVCEERLARTYETPPGAGEAWLRVLPGRSRVLVTAPHATAQTREGQTKTA